jgi:hypothetical protein
MNCPGCGLFNPSTAARCDCGYDFRAGQRANSYLSREEQAAARGAFGRSTFRVVVGCLGALVITVCAALFTWFLFVNRTHP